MILLPDRNGRPKFLASDCNAVTLLARDGRRIDLELAPKPEIARQILQIVLG